ncbi:MAG: NAD-dependent epimerase/dehydratase family protein [Phycisphaerales bacterium]
MSTPGPSPAATPVAAAHDDESGAVLVTGAAGEVGHGLLRALAEAGRSVVAVDRRELEPDERAACRAAVVADVTDAPAMEQLVREHEVGEVMHLAAMLSSSGERDPERAHAVNVGGTLQLLRIAAEQGQRSGRPVKFILPSTIAVYGVPSVAAKDAAGAVTEDQFLEPITMYGCNKLACEQLGRYYQRHYRQLDDPPGAGNIDFRAVRYPGLISPDTLPSGGTSDYAPEMIHAAVAGRPYACFVDRDARIPFMTMREAIDATLDLAAAPAERLSRITYNIGSFAPTAEELAAALTELGVAADVTFQRDALRAPIVDSWPADVDCSAAARDFGFAPRHDLMSALRDELIPGIRAAQSS